FDISILEVGEGVVEVKSTNGDTHLGGDDIDERLIEWIIDEFKKDQGINLPFVTADQSGPKHLAMKLTRAKFEQLADTILSRLKSPVEQALKDAGLDAK